MKTTLALVCSCFSFLNLAVLARGQSFSIDWFTIDGGGGTSAGGGYSLAGTIGQPDAGPVMSGGNFALAGGFWSIMVLPTPGAPALVMRLTAPASLIISWPSASSGFLLQQSSSLTAPNWTEASETINDDGVNKSITVNVSTGNRYFRLIKP